MTTASPAELDRLSTPVIEYLLRHMRPPERPDTCCGSGCAHCVWDTYEESWEEFKERRDELTREMLRRGLEPPPAPRLEKAEMDESLRVLRDLERKLNEGK
ncbi:hypothetical protein DFJ74DRAFT_672372 [Hyaloraphidium curvatum]|nr:hypothetical protein DFJ74DRAFT_672372 [Hyaloraphidium curvatum]